MSDFMEYSVSDGASGMIQSLQEQLRPEQISKPLGQTLANTMQDHFQSRNEEPNKQGWPKQNLWNRIRGATGAPIRPFALPLA